jgi:hypothetical protein
MHRVADVIAGYSEIVRLQTVQEVFVMMLLYCPHQSDGNGENILWLGG